MSNGAVTVVLFHRGSKSNGTLHGGGQASRIRTTECLEDFSGAEDDKGRHPGRGD